MAMTTRARARQLACIGFKAVEHLQVIHLGFLEEMLVRHSGLWDNWCLV
jgi:hypothetical protein